MSRRRRSGGHSVASKAAAISDAEVFTNAVADSRVTRQTSNAQAYWFLSKKHPWVRACLRIIGNAVAQESYDLVANDPDETLDDNDPIVQSVHDLLRVLFIGKCNTFRKFRKTIVIDQQTYGVGYALRKYGVKDGGKTIVALERLNPLRIVPRLNADKTGIEYYALKTWVSESSGLAEQAAAQMTTGDTRDEVQIPADQMMVFTLDEGGDDILPSPSPLEALDYTTATDFNVRRHRSSFFENGTTLGNIISSATADADQVRDAQNKLKLQAAGKQAFRNVAIGGDWKIQSLLASGGRDFDFIKGSELTIEEVCAVYSVPPSKLRDVSGSMGQAGKGEDDDTFEQECVLPIEENFYETLTIELLQKEFEIDYFSFAPQRRNKVRLDRFDAAVKLVKFGGSGNQALTLVGFPKVDDPKMDEPLFIGATGPEGVESDEIDQPAPPPQGEGDVPGDVENENTDGSTVDKAGVAKARANPKGWL